MGGSFPFPPSGAVERMRTHSLCPSEEPHALKRENMYLFSAMHLPDFQIWAHQCSPYVPHIGWESQKLIAIFRKSSPPLSRCCTNLKARKFAILCFWLLLVFVAKWTPAISLEAAQPCGAKLLVPANKRWSCGKDRERESPSTSQQWAPAGWRALCQTGKGARCMGSGLARYSFAASWKGPCADSDVRSTDGYSPAVPREGSGTGQAMQTDGFLQWCCLSLHSVHRF